MNLEEFHTQINLMASEGGASDALIPIAVRHAVQFLERNWSFKYMQGEATLAYLAAAAFPRLAFRGGRLFCLERLELLLA